MLQWQHLFPTAVVQRGREYYKKNLVRSLIRDGETYYAAVQGSREYQVTVHLRGERIESMECDCPDASEGNRCKHMAATLYEISARQIPGTRSERKAAAGKTGHVRIYPYAEENFPEEGKEREYRYYVPARFTGNLAIYADTWEKAHELLAQQLHGRTGNRWESRDRSRLCKKGRLLCSRDPVFQRPCLQSELPGVRLQGLLPQLSRSKQHGNLRALSCPSDPWRRGAWRPERMGFNGPSCPEDDRQFLGQIPACGPACGRSRAEAR